MKNDALCIAQSLTVNNSFSHIAAKRPVIACVCAANKERRSIIRHKGSSFSSEAVKGFSYIHRTAGGRSSGAIVDQGIDIIGVIGISEVRTKTVIGRLDVEVQLI